MFLLYETKPEIYFLTKIALFTLSNAGVFNNR